MSGLKKFQIKTVEHVMSLFNGGQNRVLVADETGLGKTIIAKGVIEKMAKKNEKEKYRKPLSVIYVCSNDALAKQNVNELLRKLSKKEKRREKRRPLLLLSDKRKNSDEIVIVPITPGTISNDEVGRREERALMYSIIEKYIQNRYDKEIIKLLFSYSKKGVVKNFDGLIEDNVVEKNPKVNIKKHIDKIKRIIAEIRKQTNVKLAFDETYLGKRETKNKNRERKKIIDKFYDETKVVIQKLRTSLLQYVIDKKITPKLSIFDEFQNFSNTLLGEKKQKDEGKTKQNEIQETLKVLLNKDNCKFLFLSATPFKFYATDAEDKKGEKAYQGFKEVITFLYKDKEEKEDIDNKFLAFQSKRQEFIKGNITEDEYITEKKDMEEFLYRVMCRTEKPIIEYKSTNEENEALKIHPSEYDINATLTLLQRSDAEPKKVIKLSESCPYIKSFSTKNSLDDVYRSLKDINQGGDCDEHLWLDHNTVIRGRKLDLSHAKYAFLHNTVFQNNAEKLLWIPPLKKDLPLDGPFKNARGYSKLLVFSKWSVVPDMTSVLLSYEQSKGLRVGKKILKKERDKLKSLLKDYLKKSDEIASAVVEYLTNPDAVRIINACSKANTFANRAIKYCKDGCLRETIEEYLKLESEENLINALKMEKSELQINTINKSQGQKDPFLPVHFSMPFSDKDDDIQNAFNSPFWPFVLTMTDKGAEGFNFHYYCDSIMHWNLPANPVVLEQREGRVDRFKSYAVRKAEARSVKSVKKDKSGGLYPDWMHEDKKINVYVPCYENSEECEKYKKLTEDRKKYRAAFGQDNQEEFVEFLKKHPELDVKKLSINLSPYFNKRLKEIEENAPKKTKKLNSNGN